MHSMSAIEYSRVCKTGGFEKVATAQQTRHDLRLKWSTWLAELRTAAYQLLNVACDQKAMFLLAEPQQVTLTIVTAFNGHCYGHCWSVYVHVWFSVAA
jgi:hypothetical protein